MIKEYKIHEIICDQCKSRAVGNLAALQAGGWKFGRRDLCPECVERGKAKALISRLRDIKHKAKILCV